MLFIDINIKYQQNLFYIIIRITVYNREYQIGNGKIKTYFELNIIEKFYVLFSKLYFKVFILVLTISIMRDIIVKFIYKFLDYKSIETNYSQ